ncbi:MAG TPA: response regulator [Trichormus sp.]|jgi:diguanylate cyclase (GGDEF)-like protein
MEGSWFSYGFFVDNSQSPRSGVIGNCPADGGTKLTQRISRSVLLADGDQPSSKLITTLLTDKGFCVRGCGSGKQALELLASEPFELVIVGEDLDDIDGIGFIDKLRRETTEPRVVLIANTWRDSGIYQKLRSEFAVSLIVHRPLNKQLFASQIENVFADHQLTDDRFALEEQGALALKIKYHQILPNRLKTLRQALDAVCAQPGEVALVKEAKRLAHNMKGTSRSSGFELVGDAAEQLELAMAQVQQAEVERRPELLHAVEAAFAQVDAAATREWEDTSTIAHLAKELADGQPYDSASLRVLFVSPDAIPDATQFSDISLTILSAPDEVQAMEIASKNALDAAVIDVGHEHAKRFIKLTRDLRGLPGNETLPFAFISGDGLNDLSETTYAGAALYLNKPLKPSSLSDAVSFLASVREGGRPRILIIDDDDDFCTLISSALGRDGMMVRSLNQPSSILAALDEYVPDLVLLDVNMPMVSGFEVCRMLRASGRWQDLPVIFLTAESGLDARLSAFEAGGDDYLPKPVSSTELLMRVRVRLERARLLRERADKDVLTGLLIRRAFVEVLHGIQDEAQRHGFPYCIALIDVDHFKQVNDTYGHIAGDRVLAHLGQLLRQRFRAQDARGRWGGEEFILAFRHESAGAIKGSVERVLAELRGHEFAGDHGERFNVTFSCGMAGYPEDGPEFDHLLLVADRRLYQAKESGRNRVVSADPVETGCA